MYIYKNQDGGMHSGYIDTPYRLNVCNRWPHEYLLLICKPDAPIVPRRTECNIL